MSQSDLKRNEEDYFYRLNKELLERGRATLDEKRHEQEARASKELHWMKCPKCGQAMEEIDMTGVKVDKCSGCHGLYFDQGELELLMEAKEPKGFFDVLRRRSK